MTPPFAADRPGRPARSRLWAGRDDPDTGPVPIVGGRPGPPPGRPYDEPPTAAVAPFVEDEPTAAVTPVVDDAPTAAVAAIGGPRSDDAWDDDGLDDDDPH